MKRRLVLGLMVACVVALSLIDQAAWAHIQSLAVERDAHLQSSGRILITVRGTLTCTAGEIGNVTVHVIQGNINAFGSTDIFTCTGSSEPWAITAEASDATFHPGSASALVRAVADGDDGHDEKQIDAKIRIRN